MKIRTALLCCVGILSLCALPSLAGAEEAPNRLWWSREIRPRVLIPSRLPIMHIEVKITGRQRPSFDVTLRVSSQKIPKEALSTFYFGDIDSDISTGRVAAHTATLVGTSGFHLSGRRGRQVCVHSDGGIQEPPQ